MMYYEGLLRSAGVGFFFNQTIHDGAVSYKTYVIIFLLH